MGIFKDCPAHADEVGTALLQKGLGLNRGGNPSCQKDGEVNRLLHRNRQIPEITGFPVTGADKAVHAAGEMEQIHAAVLQQPTGLHTVLHGTPSGLIVTAAQPQGNGKVIPHSLPNCLDDFPMEAYAVFHRLRAVRIGSLVGQRGEKLIEEIAVSGVKFYSVKSRLLGPEGRLGKPFRNLPDLLKGHLRRQFFPLLGVIDWTGANGRLPGGLRQCRRSRMAELSKDFDSLLVDTVGETLKGGNHIVGGDGGLTGMGLALKVDIAVFRDDQADFAVLGPFPVVFA